MFSQFQRIYLHVSYNFCFSSPVSQNLCVVNLLLLLLSLSRYTGWWITWFFWFLLHKLKGKTTVNMKTMLTFLCQIQVQYSKFVYCIQINGSLRDVTESMHYTGRNMTAVSRVGHAFFSKECNVLLRSYQKNATFSHSFAFFIKRTLPSFTFFIKERCVLCVLLRFL